MLPGKISPHGLISEGRHGGQTWNLAGVTKPEISNSHGAPICVSTCLGAISLQQPCDEVLTNVWIPQLNKNRAYPTKERSVPAGFQLMGLYLHSYKSRVENIRRTIIKLFFFCLSESQRQPSLDITETP